MKKSFVYALSLAGLTLSCSADSVSTPIPDVSGGFIVEQLTPVTFTATAGSVAANPPLIRVSNARTAAPVAGAPVQFIVGPDGGSVERYNAMTDASGLASPGKWQMGRHVGLKSLTVLVYGIKSVFYVTVTPDVPASIQQFAPLPLVAIAGEMVGGPNVVVFDQFRNPVPNVPVRFSLVAGEAEVLPPSATTSTFGSVSTSVRLGSNPGDVAVRVDVDGIEPDRFVITALDPAGVSHYTLESARQFNVVRTPAAVGVSGAILTISNFDRCLCRKESGYLILNTDYVPQTNSFDLVRRVGKFDIDPSGITISAGDFSRIKLVDDRIELELSRNDGDFIFPETWIFKPT